MKNIMRKWNLQLFDDPEPASDPEPTPSYITSASDLEPAISVDFTSRLTENITELQMLLGVTEMEPMAAGTLIKIYKMTQVNTPAQVEEGEIIPLTQVKRELARTIELTLNKYRKQTTAEAIQKVGRNLAINQTDEKIVSTIRKAIKTNFYTVLATGTGTASGSTLQAALADAWGEVKKTYEDIDATPIFFVSSDDVAGYLASATITLQTAFGWDYVENFLGLGTAIVTPALTKGTFYATAQENLRGAYIPAGAGDLAQSFGLTSDTTGLIGMTHQVAADNASINTLIFSGVKFYPEMLDGVIKGTVTGA